MSIQFYHLTITSLDKALPKILEKACSAGYRALVTVDSEEKLEQIDQMLWKYDTVGFLPHGTSKDKQPENQPILISTIIEPVNNANLLMVIDGKFVDEAAKFERVFDIFDGKDIKSVESARARWKKYKGSGHEMLYFKQNERGSWEKAA